MRCTETPPPWRWRALDEIETVDTMPSVAMPEDSLLRPEDMWMPVRTGWVRLIVGSGVREVRKRKLDREILMRIGVYEDVSDSWWRRILEWK